MLLKGILIFILVALMLSVMFGVLLMIFGSDRTP